MLIPYSFNYEIHNLVFLSVLCAVCCVLRLLLLLLLPHAGCCRTGHLSATPADADTLQSGDTDCRRRTGQPAHPHLAA